MALKTVGVDRYHVDILRKKNPSRGRRALTDCLVIIAVRLESVAFKDNGQFVLFFSSSHTASRAVEAPGSCDIIYILAITLAGRQSDDKNPRDSGKHHCFIAQAGLGKTRPDGISTPQLSMRVKWPSSLVSSFLRRSRASRSHASATLPAD